MPEERVCDDGADEWRGIARELNDTQPVWCDGTFHTYSTDDDDA